MMLPSGPCRPRHPAPHAPTHAHTSATRTRRTRGRLAVLVAAAAALVATGCGQSNGSDQDGLDSDQAGSAPTTVVTMTVGPSADATADTGGGNGTDTPAGTTAIDNGAPTEDVFNLLSPWNTEIDDSSVDPASARMLKLSSIRTSRDIKGNLVRNPSTEGVYVNTNAWTTPVVAAGVPTVIRCRQVQCGDGGADLTLDIPREVKPNPLYDGWFTVFDAASGKAYDLWRARREKDDTISYQFMRQWDLDGPGFQQPYVVSARGSGLPLFGGLIRPGELERGQVNHALAISLPGPAKSYFVQPASSTDGNGSALSVPEGARLRLKADFRLPHPLDNVTGKPLPFTAKQRQYAATLVQTLKTYGAIVVDRAAVPTLYFEDTLDDSGVKPIMQGYDLQGIHLGDFDVLDQSGERHYPYPPKDQSVNTSPASLSASTGTDSGSGTGATLATPRAAGGE